MRPVQSVRIAAIQTDAPREQILMTGFSITQITHDYGLIIGYGPLANPLPIHQAEPRQLGGTKEEGVPRLVCDREETTLQGYTRCQWS